MVGFESKRALLEYLGKNPDDRKLVDRLIAKGKVYMDGGMYILVDRGNLLDEVLRLREENERLKNFSGQNTVVENTTSSKDLEEARTQWKYWEGMARQYGKYCNDIMDVCYNKCKQILGSRFTESKDDFKDGIGEMIKKPSE